MSAPLDPTMFKPALIVLAAAGVVIPIFHRLRISPIIGFILVGIAVGPHGLGAVNWAPLDLVTITDAEGMAPIAELGVVTLMFMIGLELSFPRLLVMRRLVFGLGSLQVVLCASVLTALGYFLRDDLDLAAAVVAGLALSMSSTAIVVQLLSANERLNSPEGRATLGVLLFQDLAAVPVLFVIGVLGERVSAGDTGAMSVGVALAKAAVAIAAVISIGRLALRPLFRSVARTASPELFMAACLLVVLGTGLVTAVAGLSMAMGALIAGLLLAETEYRRQIEVTIEPFKGLLLGVFLITVGMGLDLELVAAQPLRLLLTAVVMVAAKFVVIAGLSRLFGVGRMAAVHAAMLLAPGGEFGFVILAAALTSGLITLETDHAALVLAAVTMALIPVLSGLADRLGQRVARGAAIDPALLAPRTDDDSPRVIVAGFGRVGETVAMLLETHSIAYVGLDNDPDRVARLRRAGRPVYWGDITNPELLHRLHLRTARALVITMSDHAAGDRLVRLARQARPDLLIIARARDAHHAARLYALGATDAVPETIEASLQLSESVLVDLGIPMGPVIATIHEQRAAFQTQIRAMAPGAEVRARPRRRLRDRIRAPET